MSQEKFFGYEELEFVRAHESVEGSTDQSDSGVANRVPSQLGKNAVWLKERLELVESLRSILKIREVGELPLNKGSLIYTPGEYSLSNAASPGDVVNLRGCTSGIEINSLIPFSDRSNKISLGEGRTLSLVLSESGDCWQDVRQSLGGESYSIGEVNERFLSLDDAKSLVDNLLKKISEKLDILEFNKEVERLDLEIDSKQSKLDAEKESERVNEALSLKQSISAASDESRRVDHELSLKRSIEESDRIERELRDSIGTKADSSEVEKSLAEVKEVAEAARTEEDARKESLAVRVLLGEKVDSDSYEIRQEAQESDIQDRVLISDYEEKVSEIDSRLNEKLNSTTFTEKVSELDSKISKKLESEDFEEERLFTRTELSSRVLHSELAEAVDDLNSEISKKVDQIDAESEYEALRGEISKKSDSSGVASDLSKKADKDSVWSKSESDSRYVLVNDSEGSNLTSSPSWYDLGSFISEGSVDFMIRVESEGETHYLDLNASNSSIFCRASEFTSRLLATEFRVYKFLEKKFLAVKISARSSFKVHTVLADKSFRTSELEVSRSEVESPTLGFSVSESRVTAMDADFQTVSLGRFSINSAEGDSLKLYDRVTKRVLVEHREEGSFYYNESGVLAASLGRGGLLLKSGMKSFSLVAGSTSAEFKTDLNDFTFSKEVAIPSISSPSGASLKTDGYFYSKDGKLGLESGSPDKDFNSRSLRLGSASDSLLLSKRGSSYDICRISDQDSTLTVSTSFGGNRRILLEASDSVNFLVDLKDRGERVFSRSNKPQWSEQDLIGIPQISRGTKSKFGTVQVDELKDGWAGYSILGKMSFLADSGDGFGIYDDTRDNWLLKKDGTSVELHYDGYSVIKTSEGGYLLQNRDGSHSLEVSVDLLALTQSTTAPKFKFNKMLETPSLKVGESGISSSGEVSENGQRVYSPHNKPTPESLSAVSSSDLESWISPEGRMRTDLVEAGEVTDLPEGDWWDLGELLGSSSPVNLEVEISSDRVGYPSSRLSVEIGGPDSISGSLQKEGLYEKKDGLRVTSSGSSVRIWLRLAAFSKARVRSYCFGDTSKWTPRVERKNSSPDSAPKTLLDSTQALSLGTFRVSPETLSLIYDSSRPPTTSEIGAAKSSGDESVEFNAKSLTLSHSLDSKQILLKGPESKNSSLSYSGEVLELDLSNSSMKTRLGLESEWSLQYETLDTALSISSSKMTSGVPIYLKEEGEEFLVYSSNDERGKRKLRDLESSGYEFYQSSMMFNSKSVFNTDGEVLEMNSDREFSSIRLNQKVTISDSLELRDDVVLTHRGQNFLRVKNAGDLYFGAPGGILYLGARSVEEEINTVSVVLNSPMLSEAGQKMMDPSGEVYDKGSRVYSKNNKPTPGEIGAANLQGDTTTNFSAKNLSSEGVKSSKVETSTLKMGTVEFRVNPDGSLGIFI